MWQVHMGRRKHFDILKTRVWKTKENTKYSKPANTFSVQNLTEAFTMTEFLLKKKVRTS